MYELLNEDCRDTMARMPDSHLDLVVTSPPYDKLRNYKDGSGLRWQDSVWQDVLHLLFRVMKKGGVVVWVVNDSTINGSETGTSFRQALFAKKIGFRLHDTMIWHKNNIPYSHPRYEQSFEYMFVFSKSKPNTFCPIQVPTKHAGRVKRLHTKTVYEDSLASSLIGKERTVKPSKIKDNVWYIPTGGNIATTDKIAFEHSAIFPERLAEDHILSWSKEGDLVYDPFMGSGTTGKMAVLNKRNFVGSEIIRDYYRIAETRVKMYAPKEYSKRVVREYHAQKRA